MSQPPHPRSERDAMAASALKPDLGEFCHYTVRTSNPVSTLAIFNKSGWSTSRSYLITSLHPTGQWIESVTDWAIRITDWGLFPDWVSSHARLADANRPMPNKGKSVHSGLPIALISRLPDWVVQSVLPIAIHRLLHRLYPLASGLINVTFPI